MDRLVQRCGVCVAESPRKNADETIKPCPFIFNATSVAQSIGKTRIEHAGYHKMIFGTVV
jgi:hypothetical protein